MGDFMEEATVYADEVRVASWNENKDGIFVRFELEESETHPFKHEQGQRFMMVCTRIGNDEQPDPNKPAKFDHRAAYQDKDYGEQAVTRAGILCKTRSFWDYITNLGPMHRDDPSYGRPVNEEGAARYLRNFCGIESRTELASNLQAREWFLMLEQQVHETIGQTAEPRG